MGWPYQHKPPMGWEIDPDHPLSDFVAFWPMWEGSGNKVFDLSGNGLTATEQQDSVWVPGQWGPARYFSVDDWLLVGDISHTDGLNSMSVSIWFRTSSDHNGMMIAKSDGSTGWLLYYRGAGNELRFAVTTTAGQVTLDYNPAIWADGIWHNWTAVYDGANIINYYDGIFRNQAAQTGTTTNAAENLEIGSYNGGNLPFVGDLDIPIIYNYGLTAVEVAQLYREPFCMFKDPAEVALLGGYQAVVAGMAGAMTTNTGYWGW